LGFVQEGTHVSTLLREVTRGVSMAAGKEGTPEIMGVEICQQVRQRVVDSQALFGSFSNKYVHLSFGEGYYTAERR
jgi:hypothetical protein